MRFLNFVVRRNAAIFLALLLTVAVQAQTTDISYQGQLQNASAPANGNFDFEFLLYDALTGGAQIGSTNTQNNVAVANGLFSVKLNFGANFSGANRFLEIRVRQTGGGAFTILTPRQAVTSSPYSVKSLSAVNADTAATATTAMSATNAVNATNATTAVNLSGAISGDVTGTQGATTVGKLRGIELDTAVPTDGQLLRFDGATNKWVPATVASGGSAPANYVFAYATANTSGTINFNVTQLINGWTYSAGTFTCPQSGLYLVSYTGVARSETLNSIWVRVNGVEVPGSRTASSNVYFANNGFTAIPISITKSLLVNLNAGDTLILNSDTTLVANVGTLNIGPSASLTITQVK